MSNASEEWRNNEHHLIMRILRLRKLGLIAPVLAECGEYYICHNPYDLWGSRERISIADLAGIVCGLEITLAAERYGIGRESGTGEVDAKSA